MMRPVRNPIGALRRGQQVRARLKLPRERLAGGRRRWIRTSMDWLLREFGAEVCLRPVVLPDDVIAAGYDGSLAAAEDVCARIAELMGLAPGQCPLSFGLVGEEQRQLVGTVREAAGRWVRADAGNEIHLAASLAADPTALIAIYAHEVGHELLLGAGRITFTHRPDHESLTDLLTVFFGLGIFTANAAYERRPRPNGRGKQPLARGYLRETALAEALAYYAFVRNERHPSWDRYLDPPVRRVLRNHLNVLCR